MCGVKNCPYLSLGIRKGLHMTCMRSWVQSPVLQEKKKKGSTIFVDESHMSIKPRAFSHTASSSQILAVWRLSSLLFRACEDSHGGFFSRPHFTMSSLCPKI